MAAPFLPPSPTPLILEVLTAQAGGIVLKASSVADSVACSKCGHRAQRVHSRYRRRLLDLPWQGQCVRIELTVRKLFCENDHCPRRIFTEPLSGIAARYARKTCRLADALLELVLLVGGEAAARIARTFGLLISPDALLRAAHRAPTPAFPTPKVLGIDDFAFKKGQTYGTLLIDQERRRPVDLLPDRDGATLEAWLRAHPGIQIVTRDRSTVFAEAITRAVPQAQQVADRWHLVKNLTEALTRLLDQHRSAVRQAAPYLAIPDTPPVVWPPSKGVAREEHRQGQRQKRQARADLVLALHQKGMSQRKICRLLGLARPTVRRVVGAGGMVERAPPPPRPSWVYPIFCVSGSPRSGSL